MSTHDHRKALPLGLAVLLAACAPSEAPAPDADAPVPTTKTTALADEAAEYTRATYAEDAEATLADLVAFKTVNNPDMANAENPEFQAMTAYLKDKAEALGLEFHDYGAVVVVALGEGDERLGIVTHGDVQPADPSKWAADPFSLDTESEPGRLVGRGTEDDKGPIAAALYAMKALRDRELELSRRVELIISYTEESDWAPFFQFLTEHPPPQLNVAIDAEYPVVTAEKGFGATFVGVPKGPEPPADAPHLVSFSGGAFLSQIPEDARAVVAAATPEVEASLRAAAESFAEIDFKLTRDDATLTVEARGLAAHSSKPWDGKNAITHLAAVLGSVDWPDSREARMVRYINDLVGTGYEAEKFGTVAFSHPFMGTLTLSLTVLQERDGYLAAGINTRSPAGRTTDELEAQIRQAIEQWQEQNGIEDLRIDTNINPPYFLEDAPHIPVLLGIFRRYTGQQDAEPLSIGGGTHARLLPNGINFGPAMPGEPYTGHSEHEYWEREQFLMSLEMYTAMLVELAAPPL